MATQFICDICDKVIRFGSVRHLTIEWDDSAQKHRRKYDMCRVCSITLSDIEGIDPLARHGLLRLFKNAILDVQPDEP